MSVDALGHSPRRMAKPPPPPVPPKRYLLKDPLKNPVKVPLIDPVKEPLKELAKEPLKNPVKVPLIDPVKEPLKELVKEPLKNPVKVPLIDPVKEPLKELVKEPLKEPLKEPVKEPLEDLFLRPSASPDGRKQMSAVERLAADRGKYVKSQPITLSKTPPITAVRKQRVPHSASSSGPARPNPQQPMRKAAPAPRPYSEGPLLDLEHLTSLINGMSETPAAPASQTGAASSSSQSSAGGEGDDDCREPSTATSALSALSAPDEKLRPASSASSSSSAQLSPALSGRRRAGSDVSQGSQGSPAGMVRRVDVRPQVAAVRKTARDPRLSRMPGQMQMATHAQMLQQQQAHAHAQSQAQLMYLLKAQMASKKASLLAKNAALAPPAKLPLSHPQAMAGVTPGPFNPTQPCLPPHQNSNGCSASMSPIVPVPLQPVSVTLQAPSLSPITLPQGTASPTAKLAGPQTPITPTPSLPSPLSAFFQGGGSSPAPSPCPSLTRLSSTSSRKRPSLTRSKSDMSDRFSRADADLERFFNYCGLDPADLEELAQPGSDIASVSRFRSASAPASECSQALPDDDGDDATVQSTTYGISVIEKNARVIKWLYGLRQARDPARVANI